MSNDIQSFEEILKDSEKKDIEYFFKKNNDDSDLIKEKADIVLNVEFVDTIRKFIAIRPYCSLFKNEQNYYSLISLSFEDIEKSNGNSLNFKLLNACAAHIAHTIDAEKNLKIREFDGIFPYFKFKEDFIKNKINFV